MTTSAIDLPIGVIFDKPTRSGGFCQKFCSLFYQLRFPELAKITSICSPVATQGVFGEMHDSTHVPQRFKTNEKCGYDLQTTATPRPVIRE
jgi:hypothetical protein